MKKNYIIWTIAILLLGTAFYIITMNQSSPISKSSGKTTQTVKIQAADFTLKDLNGDSISLKSLRGKNVYINFWATWCPPCKAEMIELEKLYQETKNSDLVILAIDLGEDKKIVSDFMRKNNYNFKVVMSDTKTAEIYRISSIPVSIFIDKEGNIINSQIGGMTYEQMKEQINKLK